MSMSSYIDDDIRRKGYAEGKRAGRLEALRWARGRAACSDDGVSPGCEAVRAIVEDIDAEIAQLERDTPEGAERCTQEAG